MSKSKPKFAKFNPAAVDMNNRKEVADLMRRAHKPLSVKQPAAPAPDWHREYVALKVAYDLLGEAFKVLKEERLLLASLAKCQEEPQFFNPLEAAAALKLRDEILGSVGQDAN